MANAMKAFLMIVNLIIGGPIYIGIGCAIGAKLGFIGLALGLCAGIFVWISVHTFIKEL